MNKLVLAKSKIQAINNFQSGLGFRKLLYLLDEIFYDYNIYYCKNKKVIRIW